MDVNQGRFQVNGKSGYILKPAFMRNASTEFDPITLTRGDWLQHRTFHLMVRCRHSPPPLPLQMDRCCNASPSPHQVISAQQLPKVNDKKSSIVDPLVKVEVLGVPADCTQKETQHVVNNGTFLASGPGPPPGRVGCLKSTSLPLRFQPVLERKLPVRRVRAGAGAGAFRHRGPRHRIGQRVRGPVHPPVHQPEDG